MFNTWGGCPTYHSPFRQGWVSKSLHIMWWQMPCSSMIGSWWHESQAVPTTFSILKIQIGTQRHQATEELRLFRLCAQRGREHPPGERKGGEASGERERMNWSWDIQKPVAQSHGESSCSWWLSGVPSSKPSGGFISFLPLGTMICLIK